MLGRRVGERAAAEGDPSYPLRPMQRRLASADITVGNLESTLSDDGAPTQGGDSFHADPRVRAGLRAAGFDALSLANNHAGDYGEARWCRPSTCCARRRPAAVRRGPRPGRARGGRRSWSGTASGSASSGFNAIGETPEAGPGRPGAQLGQHAAADRSARPRPSWTACSPTYAASPTASTWWW